jgi:GAF domain-containing protein
MSKPIVRIHNIQTDEVIDREMNDAEFAQYQADQAAQAIEQAELEAQTQAKADLLTRLGITEDEARLLLS